MKRFVLSSLAVFLALTLCYSQNISPSILNAAGGTYDAPASYHRFEWSFGEMLLIDSFAPPDSAVLLTHGVLQPCTEKIGNSAMTVLFESSDYRLFPNPTAGKFEVDFFVKETGRMSLQLTDAAGRVLQRRSYPYNGCCRIELFDLTPYPDGIYYVIADLKPDHGRPGDGIEIIRHSGFKVLKLSK